jgi:hypothetical protein
MIARQTLYLSLELPPDVKGESYNVGDSKRASSWDHDWPAICKYFELKGTAPHDDSKDREVRKYIKDNFATWEGIEKENGLVTGLADSSKTFPGFEYFLFTQLSVFSASGSSKIMLMRLCSNFDRQYDMTKM